MMADSKQKNRTTTFNKKVLFTLAGLLLSSHALAQPADLILENGEIYGHDEWFDAIAIREGVIVAAGSLEDVDAHAAPATRRIDLEGKTVFPGLHDMHIHPSGSGMMQLQCTFPQGSSSQVVVDTLRECADTRTAGTWIRGGQWDTSSLGVAPHKSMLDEAAPNNPVALNDISMHSLLVNSRALELAGITADTPNPPGGIIERDENGEPTGVLRESAGGLVYAVIPPPTEEQNRFALNWALDLITSMGITAFTDAGVGETVLDAYASLADAGELKLRVRACQSWNRQAPYDIDVYHARMNLYQSDRLNPDCIKIALDGVPTDGHTAAMVHPYADADHNSDNPNGILMVPPEQLDDVITEMDAHGFTVKMHAAGDGAVRAGLDAIEAARKANGFTGNLHDMAHNSFVQMDDIERATSIAATFEMSPYIWYPNPIIPDIEKAVGDERMERFTPVKDALDAGALVVPGSDWAVVPSVSPWLGMETLVTRRAPGGEGPMLGAQERITLQQAVDMYTVNAARQMGTGHQTGRIGVGMLADVIVIDRNPFEIPITEVHDTRVLMSIIEGEVVYTATEE